MEEKKDIHTHTHIHVTLLQGISVFHFIKRLKYYALSIHYFITIHSSAILKAEFLSVCMCLSFHYNISQKPCLPPIKVFFPLPHSVVLSAGKHGRWPLPSLGHALLPVFPTLFYLISLLATAPTHREFFIIQCKLLAETAC